MHKNTVGKNPNYPPKLQITPQMLLDELQPAYKNVTANLPVRSFYDKIKLYTCGARMPRNCVYITDSQNFPNDSEMTGNILIVHTGRLPADLFPDFQQNNYIEISDCTDRIMAFSLLQDFLEKFVQWDSQLKTLLCANAGVDEFGKAAYQFFQNPLTIYDENYTILSRPHYFPPMQKLEFNHAIGRYVYPQSKINEWQSDPEFLRTMNTSAPHWWSNFEGHLCLYVNIRSHNRHFKGRIVLHQDQKPLLERDRDLLQHFAEYIRIAMLSDTSLANSTSLSLKEALRKHLKDNSSFSREFTDLLRIYKWNREDCYLCACLKLYELDTYTTMNIESITCADIEDQIPQSKVFFFRKNIVMLINLTASQLSVNDIRSRMAYTIRDKLFKMGISLPFFNLDQFCIYYRQAQAAIDMQGDDTSFWCYDFKDYRLEYILKALKENEIISHIYSDTLETLLQYDRENHTVLFETLRVYLENERSIKQTALYFKVNRTTIHYRVDRIQALTGADFDDPSARLLLLLFFRLYAQ